MGIKVKIILVEAYNLIGIMEHYYSLVRQAFSIISTEVQDIGNDIALQITFKAINDITRLNGLMLMLLVYSALPRMVEYDTPSPTIAQRFAALKKTIMEIQKLQAKRLVADALGTRNGLSTTGLYDLTINLDVLVWRKGNTGQPSS
jgi:hypothetical protein